MWEKPSFLRSFPDIARMKVDAEPLGDDALEVEPTHQRTTPSFLNDPALGRDDLRKLGPLLLRHARLGTRRPIVDEAPGPGRR